MAAVVVMVSLLVVALGALGFQTSAVARMRHDRQAVGVELDGVRIDFEEARVELSESQRNLTASLEHITQLSQKVNATRNRMRLEHRRYLREVQKSEGLAAVGVQAIQATEAKAACLDVVLDAYNGYYYYEDIGIALEHALNSQACIYAGVA